jgi:chromate transporter
MTETDPEPPKSDRTAIGLWRIFAAFLWLGGTSFGGGTAGWLYREMVLRRRWIDDRDFLAMFGLGQVMPGSNGIKMTVLIGQQLRGAAGATVALLGLLTVPFAVVLAVGAFYSGFGDHSLLQAMLDGVAAAVIGLTFATGLRSLVQDAPGPSGYAIAAATVLCVGVLRWPILPVVAVLAPLSIGLAFRQARQR